MKIASLIARILLGLIFFASGLSGFLPLHLPASPGLAGQWHAVYFASHYVLFVDGIQLLAGLMLLTNRFVPLGLTVLAAVITNIIIFHVTMAPQGLPFAAIVVVLWILAAMPYKLHFMSLFVPRSVTNVPSGSA